MTALPTIHLNGTGAETIEREYRAVRHAARQAIETLEQATCNQRDYYTQEPFAWQQAREERRQAFIRLTKVMNWAEEIEAHAAEAEAKRRACR